MTIPIVALTQQGELKQAPFSVDTLTEVAHLEPEGFYTVARTYHKDRAVLLDAHFDRLEESACLEHISLNLDRSALRAALRMLIERGNYEEGRFRITIPRDQRENILLALEPLRLVTDEMRLRGVSAATLPLLRPNPRVKTNQWITVRDAAHRSLPIDVYEGIRLSDNGELTEGFSSNLYSIIDGTLRTAGEQILHGIARKIVLTVAPEILPIQMRSVLKDEIASLEEAFLTSSSRGVLPIVLIDGIRIGRGAPGPLTRAIERHYNEWVEDHLEII